MHGLAARLVWLLKLTKPFTTVQAKCVANEMHVPTATITICHIRFTSAMIFILVDEAFPRAVRVDIIPKGFAAFLSIAGVLVDTPRPQTLVSIVLTRARGRSSGGWSD
jgi:hypothetical protein